MEKGINPSSEEIIKNLLKRGDKVNLSLLKRKIAKKYGVSCPSNIELLKSYHRLVKRKKIKESPEVERLLRTRPIRSQSGIVNVSVLTKPYPCPGHCLYCPSQEGMPKSYLRGEPAAERAKRLNFNPYYQTKKRLDSLQVQGHPTDKVELRIVGGTWSYYPKQYQSWFVKECFRAANNSRKTKQSLKTVQKRNELSKQRIVGLSIETRPDFINSKEIKWLRKLGITLVELGVQSIYNDVLKLVKRGHGRREIILATKLLKDAGFKVLYQMMPNLPGSNLKRDEKMFEQLFQGPDFQPDYLKIYPCALLKEAPLYRYYLEKKYKPYSKEELILLLQKIKQKIPSYVRIQRIGRDIPSSYIVEGGARASNLRQLVQEKMKKEGNACLCIRCREVKENYNPKEKLCLYRCDYQASGGKEIFLSIENKKRTKLFSFLRLRIPSFYFKKEKAIFRVLENSAIIREIQTMGQSTPIGKTWSSPQHKGLGKRLIKEAEKIAKKEFGLKKITAISGVGARNYWRKLGFRLKDTYMVRFLSPRT